MNWQLNPIPSIITVNQCCTCHSLKINENFTISISMVVSNKLKPRIDSPPGGFKHGTSKSINYLYCTCTITQPWWSRLGWDIKYIVNYDGHPDLHVERLPLWFISLLIKLPILQRLSSLRSWNPLVQMINTKQNWIFGALFFFFKYWATYHFSSKQCVPILVNFSLTASYPSKFLIFTISFPIFTISN